MKKFLHNIADLFDFIVSGEATDAQIGYVLGSTSITADNIMQAREGILRNSILPDIDDNLRSQIIDVCGTGGDGFSTYNISTTVALLLARMGVKVAKHGNKAVSSLSGSSDVLTAFGHEVDISAQAAIENLQNNNLCFLFAPLYHPAMRYVAKARGELGVRTIFNVLGPLLNPLAPMRQLIGVYDIAVGREMALAAKHLQHAIFICGADGLDEASIFTDSYIIEKKGDLIEEYKINPRDFGLPQYDDMSLIKGGDATHNAAEMKAVLAGKKGAYADMVALNTGIALYLAGKVAGIGAGVSLALVELDK